MIEAATSPTMNKNTEGRRKIRQPQLNAMLPSAFVPLPPWIITHEQAIQAARELECRETEAPPRRDTITTDHRRAKRDKRKAREARRHRIKGKAARECCNAHNTVPRIRPIPLEGSERVERAANASLDDQSLHFQSTSILQQPLEKDINTIKATLQNLSVPSLVAGLGSILEALITTGFEDLLANYSRQPDHTHHNRRCFVAGGKCGRRRGTTAATVVFLRSHARGNVPHWKSCQAFIRVRAATLPHRWCHHVHQW